MAFQGQSEGKLRQPAAEPGFVEARLGGQRAARGGTQQRGMQFGAVALQQAERIRPAHARQQIHQRQQAQADRETVAVAHADGAIDRIGPAACITIGQREIAIGAVVALEAEEAGDTPALCQSSVTRRVPGTLQIAAMHRWQLFGRRTDEVGQ